jgi:hypothetical protein
MFRRGRFTHWAYRSDWNAYLNLTHRSGPQQVCRAPRLIHAQHDELFVSGFNLHTLPRLQSDPIPLSRDIHIAPPSPAGEDFQDAHAIPSSRKDVERSRST